MTLNKTEIRRRLSLMTLRRTWSRIHYVKSPIWRKRIMNSSGICIACAFYQEAIQASFLYAVAIALAVLSLKRLSKAYFVEVGFLLIERLNKQVFHAVMQSKKVTSIPIALKKIEVLGNECPGSDANSSLRSAEAFETYMQFLLEATQIMCREADKIAWLEELKKALHRLSLRYLSVLRSIPMSSENEVRTQIELVIHDYAILAHQALRHPFSPLNMAA